MTTPREHYLGDGAYCRIEHGAVCLYASDGIAETNHVYLGVDEVRSFLEWLRAVGIIQSEGDAT